MSEFASSVFLSDLNDFITPAQACVNPLFAPGNAKEGENAGEEKSEDNLGLPKIGLVIENDNTNPLDVGLPGEFSVKPDLIKKTSTNTAQVSLSDCLACSGCVTSAETVLIEQQSTGEFLSSLKDSSKYDHFVVTISTQTLASLASHFQCSMQQSVDYSRRFLRSIGVDVVLDLSTAGDIALLEVASEFVQRKRNPTAAKWEKPMVSKAESKGKTEWYSESGEVVVNKHDGGVNRSLPMLTSECPGWICFVEKTHPEAIPYVSTAMSPQQVSGVLVKSIIAERNKWNSSRIYHCSIMPCPDKKLEASRRDFYTESYASADVDCVLTTTELLELMQDNSLNSLEELQSLMEVVDSDDVLEEFSTGRLITSADSDGGSGGYVDFVFRHAARELFGVTIPAGPLPFKQGKNSDIKSVSLQVGGERVLNFATAYGFRNIQSIIRQMKRGRCPYDFVEIMACPGGCLNGGGQIKLSKEGERVATTLEKRNLLETVKAKLSDCEVRYPSNNRAVAHVYETILRATPYSDASRKYFHTSLHAVAKLENPLTQTW